MKLYHYAKMKAGLPYIDFSYVPEWKEIYVPYKASEPYAYGMDCATLPTTYLIRERQNTKKIQITYLQSQVQRFKFHTKSIIQAESVVSSKYFRRKTCGRPSAFLIV